MKKNGFNILSVIIIVIITSVISAVTTGIILNNNYKGISGLTYTDVMNDDELTEFLSIYSTIVSSFYEDVDTTSMLNTAIDAMKEYEGSSKEELITIATEAMISYLGDDYTTLLSKDEGETLVDQLEGTYQGIGITIQANNIIAVTKDSPAEKAGLLAGDIITFVDGVDITEENSYQIGYLIKENENKITNIKVLRGIDTLEYNIEKTELDLSISYKMIENTQTGYIDINLFSENVDQHFESALVDLESKGINNLIIDMRDNTGGYLNKTQEIASLFLEKGKVIYSLEDLDSKDYVYDETDESRNYEIVILLNNESASASEILAAALKDNSKATIVGTTSYGKGKVQKTATTDTGDVIKYTSAKWYTPNDICIDGVGISPDYEVFQEEVYNELGELTNIIDSQLEKAVNLLKEA